MRHGWTFFRVNACFEQRRPRRAQRRLNRPARPHPAPRIGSPARRTPLQPVRSRCHPARTHTPDCPVPAARTGLRPSASLRSTKTLIGKLVLDGRGHLRHQHRKPAVADDRHHLPSRIRQLRRDCERQTGRHGREHAGCDQLLTSPQRQETRGEVRVRAAIETDDRVGRERVADRADHALRPQRHALSRRDLIEQPVPLRDARLAFAQERIVFLTQPWATTRAALISYRRQDRSPLDNASRCDQPFMSICTQRAAPGFG